MSNNVPATDENKMLAIMERDHPGGSERFIALVYVEDGKTVWDDGRSVREHPIIEPTVEAFRRCVEPVSQGRRRAVLLDRIFLPELRKALMDGERSPACVFVPIRSIPFRFVSFLHLCLTNALCSYKHHILRR